MCSARAERRLQARLRPGQGPWEAFEGTGVADQEQAELRLQLARLRQEHTDFDLAINAMEAMGCDRLAVQRMKKKKLVIKDRLQDIEDQIIPDLTA